MRCLAIDPGTHCGFAVWDGEQVESGVWDYSGDESWARKWLAFDADLCSEWGAHRLEMLVYEEQQHIRGRYALLSWGWQVIMLLLCERCGIRPVAVNASTLKKWATGSGRAGKPEMIARANEWMRGDGKISPDEQCWPDITDDNEADALLLLAWAREEYGKEGEDG